jgi:protein involved in polysaccharide export with SLBB domain
MTTKTWFKIIKHPATFALALATLTLAGCSTPSQDSFGNPASEVSGTGTNATSVPDARRNANDPEILQIGDSVSVIYSDLPSMTMPWEGEIKSDGTVTLLLNQTFKAAGLNRTQLEKDIRERYVPRFYKQMTVSVNLTKQTRFYYVGGEVRGPGRQFYLGRLTISKAIQSAGDFTDFAKKTKVELTRAGAAKPIIINVSKAMQDATLDVEIYPGDKIHVPRRIW